MSIITAQRLNVDMPIEISSRMVPPKEIDADAAKATVRKIERLVGGTVLDMLLIDDLPLPPKLDVDLATVFRNVYLSSPHFHSLLETASLVVTIYSTAVPTVSPSKQDPQAARYSAGLENKLVLACRNWWRENRPSLRCVSSATFILNLGTAHHAIKVAERKAALVERMVVALARQHVSDNGRSGDISECLAEYDKISD